MKASVKLRAEDHKSPLFRFKLPVSILGFPFVSAATAGDPGELALHLRTALPCGGPSVKLTYCPTPLPPSDPHHFSLTLKSGVGPWGSPHKPSPLVISATLSLGTGAAASPHSFSILLKPQIGDFSLRKIAASSSSSSNSSSPNPKENGGGVHHPIPISSQRDRNGLEDFLSSGAAVSTTTTLPVTGRAALKLRWGVNVSETAVSRWRRLPYLTVEKISIEPGEEREEKGKTEVKEGGGMELEAMKGMCFWMKKEVEELQRENGKIKESLEQFRRIASDGKEVETKERKLVARQNSQEHSVSAEQQLESEALNGTAQQKEGREGR